MVDCVLHAYSLSLNKMLSAFPVSAAGTPRLTGKKLYCFSDYEFLSVAFLTLLLLCFTQEIIPSNPLLVAAVAFRFEKKRSCRFGKKRSVRRGCCGAYCSKTTIRYFCHNYRISHNLRFLSTGILHHGVYF